MQLAVQTITLQSQPQNAALWHSRAQSRITLRDLQGAAKDLSEAIGLAPFNVEYRVSRASLFAGTGNWPSVIADSTRGLTVSPRQTDLLLLRARGHASLGQAAGADNPRASRHNPDGASADPTRSRPAPPGPR